MGQLIFIYVEDVNNCPELQLQPQGRAAARTMLIAAALVAAVTITGAGLWSGANIACASSKFEDACEKFDSGFPTISMLM